MKIKLGNLNVSDTRLRKQLGLSRQQVIEARSHLKKEDKRHGHDAASPRSR